MYVNVCLLYVKVSQDLLVVLGVWNKTYDPSCQPISSREWEKYYPRGHDELLGHRSVNALLKL